MLCMDMKGQPKKIAAFKIEGHLDSRFAKARFEKLNLFEIFLSFAIQF